MFSERRTDPVCWDLASGKPLYNQKTKAIKGLDCGKYTWVDLVSNNDHKLGTAGRQNFNLHTRYGEALLYPDGSFSTWYYDPITSITVGPYDS